MPSARVNGVNLFYEEHGSGEPVVLIGGLGSDISLTTHLTRFLEPHFNVVAFDNRGAGRSDKPDAPYTIEQMAADTLGLMDHLGIGRAHVLGISMGGRIALELAIARAERVHKLVLVSTAARAPAKLRMSLPMMLLAPLRWLLRLTGKDPQPRYAHERQRMASRSYDAGARLGQIQAPTLILHGRSDRSAPLSAAERMHAGITGSSLRVFRGGHMFFLVGDRQRFLESVGAFLAA